MGYITGIVSTITSYKQGITKSYRLEYITAYFRIKELFYVLRKAIMKKKTKHFIK